MNLKALAEYVGTSVAMIEKSYGRYISDLGLAPLIRAVEPTAAAAPTTATGKPPGKSGARPESGNR